MSSDVAAPIVGLLVAGTCIGSLVVREIQCQRKRRQNASRSASQPEGPPRSDRPLVIAEQLVIDGLRGVDDFLLGCSFDELCMNATAGLDDQGGKLAVTGRFLRKDGMPGSGLEVCLVVDGEVVSRVRSEADGMFTFAPCAGRDFRLCVCDKDSAREIQLLNLGL